jgi:hypothetical protein
MKPRLVHVYDAFVPLTDGGLALESKDGKRRLAAPR